MQNVDILGTENVLKYIEATKLTKFTIQRAEGGGQYIPVFECIDSDTNNNAIAQFKNWSEVVNQSRPYKISLFDYVNLETLPSGELKASKGKFKGNKMEATFQLSNVISQSSQNNTQQTANNFSGDFATLKADIIREIGKNQEENAILNEIKALKQKFAELDEEEEEDEPESNIGGIDTSQLSQIMGLVNLFKNQNTPPVINGVETKDLDQVKANINQAIKILYKNDKSLDTDLQKLAELSETKPELFKMLLENLRTL